MMILGVVQWMQPVHGYDVRRELLGWGADKWANIQPGSIYHALRKLAAEGLLREVTTEQVGARPARTTYEVTDKGAAEFQTLLRGHFWEVSTPPDPFLAAFAFLPSMPREEAVAALRARMKLLQAGIDHLRSVNEADWAKNKPPYVWWMWDLTIERSEAEIRWCERTAKLIEDGTSYQPPGAPVS